MKTKYPAVRTAVIPVAGLGTRFLPATKTVPKEMLPLLDRPCIDYIVKEAADAGIERIVFVTARGKDAMVDYFDRSPALEAHLRKVGKVDLLEKVLESGKRVDVIAIRQRETLGLGHAVLCAKAVVGEEPFAVLLGDDIVFNKTPTVGDMIKVYNKSGDSVVALMEVPQEDTQRYGICAGEWENEDCMRIKRMVEKPHPKLAPSNFGIVGRYVLPASIFKLLEETPPGKGGEIQLTDAIHMQARKGKVIGYKIKGQRFDTGNALGLLRASMYQALQRPDLRVGFKKILQEFKDIK
ncbi:MAG: UTP--glucose-1-phosphate uridylyltransferase GalU [Myxococcota bacterium]|nr:UTP--glucose-1-phosphate uridylyltransferase GalU [Myxococcota bacterium]